MQDKTECTKAHNKGMQSDQQTADVSVTIVELHWHWLHDLHRTDRDFYSRLRFKVNLTLFSYGANS